MQSLNSPRASAFLVGFGGMVTMAAVMGIGRFVYTPILPVMVEALGLTKSQAGLIASANYVGYLVGAIVAMANVPGGKRRWFLGALVASVSTTAAMAVVDTLPVFIVLRFVGGVSSAFGFIFSAALVMERLGALNRSELSWMHFAGVGVGMTISAAVVALLAEFSFGWRAMWTASALLSLCAAAFAVALVPKGGAAAGSAPVGAGAPQPRALATIVLAYGLFGFGYIITATFIVAIVRGTAEVRALEPFVWMVVGLAAIPSVYFWGRVAARIGALRAYALGCLVEAVGIAASVLWVTPVGILFAAVCLGGTFAGVTALGLMASRTMTVGDPSRVVATMTVAFALGQIVGPIVAGYAFDLTGSFAPSSLAAAGALGVSALLALAIRR